MILDEFTEFWQALPQYFADYENDLEIDRNRLRRLQHEALRPPKAPREPPKRPKVLLERSGEASGSFPDGPWAQKKEGPENGDRYHSIFGVFLAPFRQFSIKKSRPGAKTVKCLKMMTLIALWLCSRGPRDSNMRSKYVQDMYLGTPK